MIEITYDPVNGTPIADGRVVSFANEIVEVNKLGLDVRRTIASETVIHELRLRVAKGKIAHTDIVFVYNGQELRVEKDGGYPIDSWPIGCGDFLERKCFELLHYMLPITGKGKQ